MKSRKFTLAILCLWLCLGTFVLASNLEARDLFLNQEICWEVERDGELHSTLRLTVTRTGKGHFFLNGYIIFADQSISPYMATGEIIDGQLVMVGTTSRSSPEIMTKGTRRDTLDLQSLNGTGEALGTIYNKDTGEVTHNFWSSSVTRIPCRSLKDN